MTDRLFVSCRTSRPARRFFVFRAVGHETVFVVLRIGQERQVRASGEATTVAAAAAAAAGFKPPPAGAPYKQWCTAQRRARPERARLPLDLCLRSGVCIETGVL